MTRPSFIPSLSPAAPAGRRLSRTAPLLALTLLAAGCTTVKHPNPNDPWESYNRSMYAFNTKVDDVVMKPIAKGYQAITPKPARTCIHNMFNNVEDLWSAFNSFIQGRGVDFFNTLGRVLVNTTLGLGGCFDVNTQLGGKRIANDFGTTLGVWGVGQGPYFVLPFLGPSTVRDTAATATTAAATFSDNTQYFSPLAPIMAIDNIPVRNGVLALQVVDARANLLDAEKIMNQIALDKYSFIRDAYLQRRHALLQSKLHGKGASALPNYGNDQSLPDYSDPALPKYDDPDQTSYSGVVPVQAKPTGRPVVKH